MTTKKTPNKLIVGVYMNEKTELFQFDFEKAN